MNQIKARYFKRTAEKLGVGETTIKGLRGDYENLKEFCTQITSNVSGSQSTLKNPKLNFNEVYAK